MVSACRQLFGSGAIPRQPLCHHEKSRQAECTRPRNSVRIINLVYVWNTHGTGTPLLRASGHNRPRAHLHHRFSLVSSASTSLASVFRLCSLDAGLPIPWFFLLAVAGLLFRRALFTFARLFSVPSYSILFVGRVFLPSLHLGVHRVRPTSLLLISVSHKVLPPPLGVTPSRDFFFIADSQIPLLAPCFAGERCLFLANPPLGSPFPFLGLFSQFASIARAPLSISLSFPFSIHPFVRHPLFCFFLPLSLPLCPPGFFGTAISL